MASRYDPQHRVQPSFRAFRLTAGDLVELPPPVNGIYYSPLLGTELRVIGPWLRVINPATGQPFPLIEELEAEREREATARKAAEKREQAAALALRAALEELARLMGEDTTGT
jgi:hypothetical protein